MGLDYRFGLIANFGDCKMIERVTEYVFYSLLGAITYTIVRWGFWRELGYDYLIRHFLWGIISGIIVASFNLPNHITAFGLGYFGIDVAEGFLNRLLRNDR